MGGIRPLAEQRVASEPHAGVGDSADPVGAGTGRDVGAAAFAFGSAVAMPTDLMRVTPPSVISVKTLNWFG